jgi:hypothetical protein
MVPFCRGPEKLQAGCYELAHVTPSEARLLLLRGRAAARVYAIGIAMAMEAAPCGLYRLASCECCICSTRSAIRRKKPGGRVHAIGARRLSEWATPE